MTLKDLKMKEQRKVVAKLLQKLFNAAAPLPEPEDDEIFKFFREIDQRFGDYFPLQAIVSDNERTAAEYENTLVELRKILIRGEGAAQTLCFTDGLRLLQRAIDQRVQIPLACLVKDSGVAARFSRDGELTHATWLTDLDIQQALRAVGVQERVAVKTFSPEDLGYELYLRRTAMERAGKTQYKLYFILNTSSDVTKEGSHWVRLCVDVNAEAHSIRTTYTDSLRVDAGQRSEIERRLQAALAWRANETEVCTVTGEMQRRAGAQEAFLSPPYLAPEITVIGAETQKDSWSCGYWALRGTASELQKDGVAVAESEALLRAEDSRSLEQAVCSLVLSSARVILRSGEKMAEVFEKKDAAEYFLKPAVISKAIAELRVGRRLSDDDMVVAERAKSIVLAEGCIEKTQSKYPEKIIGTDLDTGLLVEKETENTITFEKISIDLSKLLSGFAVTPIDKKPLLKRLFDEIKKVIITDFPIELSLQGYDSLNLNEDEARYFRELLETVPNFSKFSGDHVPESLLQLGTDLAQRNAFLIEQHCLPGGEATDWWRTYATRVISLLRAGLMYSMLQATRVDFPPGFLRAPSIGCMLRVLDFMGVSGVTCDGVAIDQSLFCNPSDIKSLIQWLEENKPPFSCLQLTVTERISAQDLLQLLSALSKNGIRELELMVYADKDDYFKEVTATLSKDLPTRHAITTQIVWSAKDKDLESKAILLEAQDEIARHRKGVAAIAEPSMLTGARREVTVLKLRDKFVVGLSQQLQAEEEEEEQQQQQITSHKSAVLGGKQYDDFDSSDLICDRVATNGAPSAISASSASMAVGGELDYFCKFWDEVLGQANGIKYATHTALVQMFTYLRHFKYGIDLANLSYGFFIRRRGEDLVLCFDAVDCPTPERNFLTVELSQPPLRSLALYGSAAQFDSSTKKLKSVALKDLDDTEIDSLLCAQCRLPEIQIPKPSQPSAADESCIRKGLLMLLVEKGSKDVKLVLDLLARITESFGPAYCAKMIQNPWKDNDTFAGYVFDFATLLEANTLAAVDYICQLDKGSIEYAWWIILSMQHFKTVGPSDLSGLVNGFRFFCAEIKKLGLAFDNPTPGCFYSIENMLVVLSRILTILKNARDPREQWACLLGSKLDLGPDGAFVASYCQGFRLVTKEMALTPEELEGEPPTYAVTSKKLIEIGTERSVEEQVKCCYRYLGMQEQVAFEYTEYLRGIDSISKTTEHDDTAKIHLLTIFFLATSGRGCVSTRDDQEEFIMNNTQYLAFSSWLNERTLQLTIGLFNNSGHPQPTLGEINAIWKVFGIIAGVTGAPTFQDFIEYVRNNYSEYLGAALMLRAGVLAGKVSVLDFWNAAQKMIGSALTSEEQTKVLYIIELFGITGRDDANLYIQVCDAFVALKQDAGKAFPEILDRLVAIDENTKDLWLRDLLPMLKLRATALDPIPVLDAITIKGWQQGARAAIVVPGAGKGVIGLLDKFSEYVDLSDLRDKVATGVMSPKKVIEECWRQCQESLSGFGRMKQLAAKAVVFMKMKKGITDYLRERLQTRRMDGQGWFTSWAVMQTINFCETQKIVMGDSDPILQMLGFEELLESFISKIVQVNAQYSDLWKEFEPAIGVLPQLNLESLTKLNAVFSVFPAFRVDRRDAVFSMLKSSTEFAKVCTLDVEQITFILKNPQARDIWSIVTKLAGEERGGFIALLQTNGSLVPIILKLYSAQDRSAVSFMKHLQTVNKLLAEDLRQEFFHRATPASFAEVSKLLGQEPSISDETLKIIFKIITRVTVGLRKYVLAENGIETVQAVSRQLTKFSPSDLQRISVLYDSLPYPSAKWLLNVTAADLDAQIKEFKGAPFGERKFDLFDIKSGYSIFSIVNRMVDLSARGVSLASVQRYALIDWCTQIGSMVHIGIKAPDFLQLTPSLIVPAALSSLTGEQLQALIKNCVTVIRNKDQTYTNQLQANLLFLTLACEAMYRTTGSFPYPTQVLSVLYTVLLNRNVMPEIATGQGKTLITGLCTAMLWANGGAVDICTSSAELAERDYEENREFFTSLGINVGLLTASSEDKAYKTDGVNYSTVGGFVLFRARQAPDSELRVPKADLWIDEADAVLLDDQTKYRLAGKKPGMGNADWSWLYEKIYNFISAQINSTPSADELTVAHEPLIDAILTEAQNKGLGSAAQQQIIRNMLSSEQLELWIQSVWRATKLKRDEDFKVEEYDRVKADGATEKLSCVVVLTHNRPSKGTIYSDGLQQFLCVRLNQEKAKETPRFLVEPEEEVLTSSTVRDFIDSYLEKERRVIGVTGTVGSLVERAELTGKYALSMARVPQHQPRIAVQLPVIHTKNQKKLESKLIEQVRLGLKRHQPILIHVNTVAEAQDLAGKLSNSLKRCQRLDDDGSDLSVSVDVKEPKVQVVTALNIEKLAERTEMAGHAGMITISTIMDRGTDIKLAGDKEKQYGLLNISTSLDLSERLERQRAGRAGRKGEPGTIVTLVNDSLSKFTGQSLDTLRNELYARQQVDRARREVDSYLLRKIQRKYLVLYGEVQKTHPERLFDLRRAWGIFFGKAESTLQVAGADEKNSARQSFATNWNAWVGVQCDTYGIALTEDAAKKTLTFANPEKLTARLQRMERAAEVFRYRGYDRVNFIDHDYIMMADADACYKHLAELSEAERMLEGQAIYRAVFGEDIGKNLSGSLQEELEKLRINAVLRELLVDVDVDAHLSRSQHLLAVVKYAGDGRLQQRVLGFYRKQLAGNQSPEVRKVLLLHYRYALMNFDKVAALQLSIDTLKPQIRVELERYQKKSWFLSSDRKVAVTDALEALGKAGDVAGVLGVLNACRAQIVKDDIEKKRTRIGGSRGRLLRILDQSEIETLRYLEPCKGNRDALLNAEIAQFKDMVSLLEGRSAVSDEEDVVLTLLKIQNSFRGLTLVRPVSVVQADLFLRTLAKSQEIMQLVALRPELQARYDQVVIAQRELLNAFGVLEIKGITDMEPAGARLKKYLAERGVALCETQLGERLVFGEKNFRVILPTQNQVVVLTVSEVSEEEKKRLSCVVKCFENPPPRHREGYLAAVLNSSQEGSQKDKRTPLEKGDAVFPKEAPSAQLVP